MRIFLILGLLLSTTVAQAAETEEVVSLFEGTSQEGKIDAPQEEAEESSIFSFLNFKKPKKEEAKLNVANAKRLSPLEQSTKLADNGDVNAQLL